MPKSTTPLTKRLARWMLAHEQPVPLALEHPAQQDLAEAADEIERLEKERFKYETALMLIGQGYPGSEGLAKAALTKSETV